MALALRLARWSKGMAKSRFNSTEFAAALRDIERPRGRQIHFLQAHYSAPGRAMTAAKLAKAARYQSWSGLNLQYGIIAKKIGRALGARDFDLSGLVEFAPPSSLTNRHWVLIMRPEFARALKTARWVEDRSRSR